MKRCFALFLAALAASLVLASGSAVSQSLNVQMPVGSRCPTGYHWENVGFAQCIIDAPPTPPVPPVAAYTYIYLVGSTSVQCNGNGCHSLTRVERTTTSNGKQWTTVFSVMDDPNLPWIDLTPYLAINPQTTDPTVLRAWMGPFIAANCALASDSGEAKSIISNAVGYNVSNVLYAGSSNVNVGQPQALNYALCPTSVM
ncbi:hypothetical protein LMG19282_01473 [Cupriavidus campinensis]|nr:hypothetical protein LMG19282_01473 [Cupriavidus campinensis]